MEETFGKRIEKLLRDEGIPQKDLAKMLGISEGTMSRYISGERSPRPEMLANIATALHTTSDYLLGIENEEFDYPRVRRVLARNASSMTMKEKKALVNALLGED